MPDSVIDATKEYGSNGVSFSSTSCSFEEGSGSNRLQCRDVDGSRDLDGDASEEAVKKLFETANSLYATVAAMKSHIKNMMETFDQANANPVNPT